MSVNGLPSQSVYTHFVNKAEQALQKGTLTLNQTDLDQLAKVADLHQEGPNAKGAVYTFQDSSGVSHALSVKDFEVAGGIFKGMDLTQFKNGNAHITVNADRTAAILKSGTGSVPGAVGKVSATPGNAAQGQVRIIHVTGGSDIKIVGKVSPQAEKLIADGWLSDNDMHKLHAMNKSAYEYSGQIGDTQKSAAGQVMSLLYQRQIDHTGTVGDYGNKGNYGNGKDGAFTGVEKRDHAMTYENLVANPTVGGEFQHNTKKGALEDKSIGFQNKTTANPKGEHLKNFRAALAEIDNAVGIAPEDKQYLKQLAGLKYVAQHPDPAGRGTLGRGMEDLPSLADVNDALKAIGYDPATNNGHPVVEGVDMFRVVKGTGKVYTKDDGKMLAHMLSNPEKYTLVLEKLARQLDLPTSK